MQSVGEHTRPRFLFLARRVSDIEDCRTCARQRTCIAAQKCTQSTPSSSAVAAAASAYDLDEVPKVSHLLSDDKDIVLGVCVGTLARAPRIINRRGSHQDDSLRLHATRNRLVHQPAQVIPVLGKRNVLRGPFVSTLSRCGTQCWHSLSFSPSMHSLRSPHLRSGRMHGIIGPKENDHCSRIRWKRTLHRHPLCMSRRRVARQRAHREQGRIDGPSAARVVPAEPAAHNVALALQTVSERGAPAVIGIHGVLRS
jgi:hypothetical protein